MFDTDIVVLSTSTPCYTPVLQNYSTLPTVVVLLVCYLAWVVWLVLLHHLLVSGSPFQRKVLGLIIFSGAQYIGSNNAGILWLGAGGIWLSAFVMIFLPVEMRKRQMY